MKKQIIMVIMIVLISLTARTQSLEELLSTAFDNNPELRMLENEFKASLERAPQVSELPDPEIGVGAFPLPVETRLGAQLARLSATQMFPWKGVLEQKKELEISRSRALYERISVRALDLFFEIKQAYFRMYEIRESQSVIREDLDLLESLERLALSQVESGKASGADVLRVRLRMEELSQQLNILDAEAKIPASTINQLLSRETGTPVYIADSLSFAQIIYKQDTLPSRIRENHPAIRMLQLQQDVSREAIEVNALDRKPSFGVGVDYILVDGYSDSPLGGNGRDILQLRAAVKIPLYRKKYDARDREENWRIAALENRKVDLVNQYLSSIEKAYSDHEAARLRFELADRQIRLTQSAIDMLRSSYSVGEPRFDEILRLEEDMIRYDLMKLRAVVQSHLAKSLVERFVEF